MLRLAVRVQRDRAEIVLTELLELAPGGVEEVRIGDELIEYAVYGAPGELPALPDLRAAAGGALVAVATEEIADDWADRWRQFHKPLVLGDRLTVRPPWEPPGHTPIDLVVDPGRAFGTGAHATTRLCLELMLELEARDAFVDLGCGSGVLAIAAACLGFSPVLALDHDRASVEAALANAALNGVEIDVRRHDLRVDPTPPAATIAANLSAPLLTKWAAVLGREGDVPERVIASGLLAREADGVASALSVRGLAEAGRWKREEWAALLLERRSRG